MIIKHAIPTLLLLCTAQVQSAKIIGTSNAMLRPRAKYVTKNGDFLYVSHTEEDGLEIIDVSTAGSPTSVDSKVITPKVIWPGKMATNAARTRMYVTYQSEGSIKVFDITAVPMQEVQSTTRYYLKHCILDETNDLLYVAGGSTTGMSSVTLSPTVQVSQSETSFKAVGFAVDTTRNLAYGVSDRKLQIADISNPTTLIDIISTTNIIGKAYGVFTVNQFIYIASTSSGSWKGGVHILDATDSSAPVLISDFPLNMGCKDVVWDADTLFVACPGMYSADPDGVAIVDVTNKAAPSLKEVINTPGMPMGLVVERPYIYVADGSAGVHVIDINAVDTDAPDTLAPATPAPLTPAPATVAPATPAPPTQAPATPAPATPFPDTSAPDTSAPDTPAPDTLAPSTRAPDTAVPTAAPDTPSPPTVAPPTPFPDTTAPSTPAPSTPAPSTPAPSTPAPSTPAPDTTAPETLVPDTQPPATVTPDTAVPTVAPPTSAPPTLVPLTQPPTSSPPTVPPSTFVPNTDAPPTTAPATLTPTQTPTSTPATAIPPTALPTAAPLVTASPDGKKFQWRLRPDPFTGDVIRGGGGTMHFSILGRLLEHRAGVPLSVVLVWPGGSMTFGNSGLQGRTPPVTCGGGACVILETDKAPDAAGVGFAAASKRNNGTVTAKVSDGRDGVDLMIRDGNYQKSKGKGEVVTVLLREELFGASSSFVCGNAADGMECECGVGCKVTVPMKGDQNTLPNHEQLEGTTAAATASVTVVAAAVPASASAGPALVRASLVQRMMLCPSDGTTELDRTLNPLGLTIGSGVNKEVNGALVGSVGMQVALVLAAGTAVTIVRSRHPGESTLYILARARVGWSLIPIQFLFGGSVLSCFAALLYSTMGFKVLAAVDLAVFPGLFAVYAWKIGRVVPRKAYVEKVNTTSLQWAFWGKQEWVSWKTPGDGAWCGLNGLSYDAYRPGIFRYYLCWELLTTFLMGIVSAWEPPSTNQCMTKAAFTAAILGAMLLVLMFCPYIAPYENFLDTCVVGMELVVTILITVALGSSHPTDHWTAGVAGQLSMVIVYVILLKFAIDLVVFTIDEHSVWDEKGRKGSFVAHFLCCGNSIEEDDDEKVPPGIISLEDLQPQDSFVRGKIVDTPEIDLMGGSVYSNFSVLNKSSRPQTPRTPPVQNTGKRFTPQVMDASGIFHGSRRTRTIADGNRKVERLNLI